MRVTLVLYVTLVFKICNCIGLVDPKFLGGATNVLDISNPNFNLINYSARAIGNTSFKMYTAKEGISIVSLIDSEFPVWNAEPGVKFKSAKSYTNTDDCFLVICAKHNGIFKFQYFVKTGLEWEGFARELFPNALETMFP